MKKVNFNTINDLKASEAMIEKALSVPAQSEQGKTIPLSFRRRLIAAASVILVTALSLTLIPNIGKAPVEIMPSPTDSPTSSSGNVYTVPSQAPESTDIQSASQSFVTDVERIKQAIDSVIHQPSTDSSVSQAPDVPTTSAAPVIPTASPTQGNAQAPTVPHSAPTQSVTDAPTTAPTQSESQTATEHGTQPATEKPTVYHGGAPTELPVYPSEHVAPSQPATADPSEPNPVSYVIIRSLNVKPGTVIYCRITDRKETVVYGDPDLYSDEHLAVQISTGVNSVAYKYSPGEHGLMLIKEQAYFYSFYDSDGNVLATGGFIHI